MADKPEPEVIRQQMQETRSALTDKLEKLEQQVVDTVQEAKCTVTETVETVKEAVGETVDTVKGSVESTVETLKEACDLRLQTERHPWGMFSASVALGLLGGLLFPSRTRSQRPAYAAPLAPSANNYMAGSDNGWDTREPDYEPLPQRRSPLPEERKTPSGFSRAAHSVAGQVQEALAPQMDKLKGLAIGAAMAIARDMVGGAVSDELGQEINRILDEVTVNLGGKPLHGSPWRPEHEAHSGEAAAMTEKMSASQQPNGQTADECRR